MTYFKSTAEFIMALHLARKFYAEDKAERDQEEREAAEQGYRPHYCIHGTNQWTEYDNICGGCEEGVTLRSMAVHRAWGRVAEAHRRVDLVIGLMGMMRSDLEGLGIAEKQAEWVEWALEPTKLD